MIFNRITKSKCSNRTISSLARYQCSVVKCIVYRSWNYTNFSALHGKKISVLKHYNASYIGFANIWYSINQYIKQGLEALIDNGMITLDINAVIQNLVNDQAQSQGAKVST